MLAWLGLCAWAAITFLGSTVTGSTAAAAGIGFVALLVLSIVSAIPSVGAVHPRRAGGTGDGARRPGTPVEVVDVLVPALSTVVWIALALGGAAWSFRRREL